MSRQRKGAKRDALRGTRWLLAGSLCRARARATLTESEKRKEGGSGMDFIFSIGALAVLFLLDFLNEI